LLLEIFDVSVPDQTRMKTLKFCSACGAT